MPDRPNRSIVYDPDFDAQLTAIKGDFFAAEECLQGLLWILVRDPEAGFLSDTPHVWYFPLVRSDFPPVTVFYTFNDTELCFLGIERLDAGNGHGH